VLVQQVMNTYESQVKITMATNYEGVSKTEASYLKDEDFLPGGFLR
jgi:hypothetical protein